MKTGRLFYFFSGYLTVCADGPFTERLINICLHRGMNICNIKRCGNNRVIFTTDVRSFLKIRTPARRTKSHIKIIKRKGLPFILKRYRHRKLAASGVLILILFLWYASNHVMGITVFGNDRVDTQSVINLLEECGLKLGTKTSEVDPDILRNRMMIKNSDLAWVGVNANGSRVYIEIVERVEKEKGVEKDGPVCNLIASNDGEIERMEIREGQSVVQLGSGVRKGDVLVSGIVDSPVVGFRYIKARGDVFAKTRYTKTRSYPLKYTDTIETGNIKKRYSVSILNLDIPLYIGEKEPYDNFIYEEQKKEYRIPIDILPSVFIGTREYTETKAEEKTRTVTEAVEFGKAELIEELRMELNDGVEVIEENMSYTLTELGEAMVTVELVCRENIAEESVIEIDQDINE